MGFPGGLDGKESACNEGDWGSIPGPGRSPGEGNDNPLQYPCMENSMAREAWQAIVHGVAKSQTRLNITNTQIGQYSSDDLCRKSLRWDYRAEGCSEHLSLEFKHPDLIKVQDRNLFTPVKTSLLTLNCFPSI